MTIFLHIFPRDPSKNFHKFYKPTNKIYKSKIKSFDYFMKNFGQTLDAIDLANDKHLMLTFWNND